MDMCNCGCSVHLSLYVCETMLSSLFFGVEMASEALANTLEIEPRVVNTHDPIKPQEHYLDMLLG